MERKREELFEGPSSLEPKKRYFKMIKSKLTGKKKIKLGIIH